MSPRVILAWLALAAIIAVPVTAAMLSPLLAWRGPVYIAAGLAGVIGMALLLVQPLLAANLLPGLSAMRARRIHRWTGATLVIVIVLHVGGLWITSPPDVIDALLFRSPTPFSLWGVIGMWAVFATAIVSLQRRRIRPLVWRALHAALSVVIVATSILHAMLIEGTMEFFSKSALCAFVALATWKAMSGLRLRPRRPAPVKG